MSLPYLESLELIRHKAEYDAIRFRSKVETVSIYKAVNRISHMTLRCQKSTPGFDTSAMNGYALNSAATQSASGDIPAIFRICGAIAAGEEPLSIEPDTDSVDTDEIPFFGLPGDPVASAVCLQFLVVPYLKFLQGQPLEPVLEARVMESEHREWPTAYDMASQPLFKVPKDLDVFRPGMIHRRAQDCLEVTPMEHSPSKIKPFLGADCWLHIPAGVAEIHTGDTVSIVTSH
ncbi:hypothetical protein N8T08_002878 [Aspergillus melleus]|uniref:Uncharacterized protein n=1 Tax=Aspergillus melleus TaxID=138277 RepID=A0ACC3B813_9EURO|nr:hypothetical protein N8T08_002878 [Aspergillus melleus]